MRRTFIAATALGLAAAAAGCGTTSSSSGSTGGGHANIYVVASKSFCIASGIDDIYTGDGHVEFFVTLHNSGDKDGSVNVIPVRHYSDGQSNESPMDMMSVDVPAGQTYKFHSPEFKYKAHEHAVDSCGLDLGSGEIGIGSQSL